MWSSLVILALCATAQGRAVNISNTWVLPEEGFPVFYRYFRDRISWYEADAVCQFHHANLVTVDTTAQYDAVRAYLKELDISSAVWVGLIRSNPDGDFTWTDYRGLSGDGYWSTAPDTRSAPLCAAANPSADYRWEARACGGPTVASFICELPVPQWALGDEGCMVKELPALTILYLPESAAVQLNGDCGLAGVKSVQCTGNVKREDLLKDLSCAVEEDVSSSAMPTSISTAWSSTSDPTDDTINEATTEEVSATDHSVEVNQQILITATSIPQYINSRFTNKESINIDQSKNVHLGENDDHNILSNIIPRIVEVGNVLTNDHLEKLENERQTIMFHDEIARVGNVENIFTQPTDHFIPPLVMAKSRMSDDMTVLSLAEKHAQQLSERHFNKHTTNDNNQNRDKSIEHLPVENPSIGTDKFNSVTKKENLKSHVPKKYVNEKYYETKGKIVKLSILKPTETSKEITPVPTSTHDFSKSTTTVAYSQTKKAEDDFGMDLTVMLKDAPYTSEEGENLDKFSGDVVKLDSIKEKLTSSNQAMKDSPTTEYFAATSSSISVDNNTQHEIVQITVVSNSNAGVNTSVFEITTKMPIFKDDITVDNKHSTNNPAPINKTPHIEETNVVTTETIFKSKITEISDEISTVTSVGTEKPSLNITSASVLSTTTTLPDSTSNPILENKMETTDLKTTITTTSAFHTVGITAIGTDKLTTEDSSTDKQDTTHSYEPEEPHDSNATIITDVPDRNTNDTEYTGDENSPLLSGAYEPMHRPARTRTPQQQNRKFNPFRILG